MISNTNSDNFINDIVIKDELDNIVCTINSQYSNFKNLKSNGNDVITSENIIDNIVDKDYLNIELSKKQDNIEQISFDEIYTDYKSIMIQNETGDDVLSIIDSSIIINGSLIVNNKELPTIEYIDEHLDLKLNTIQQIEIYTNTQSEETISIELTDGTEIGKVSKDGLFMKDYYRMDGSSLTKSIETKDIYVYFSSFSVEDNGTTIFVNTLNHKNALQRAIENIPNDTIYFWNIYVYGDLMITSIDDLTAVDNWNNEYLSLISITNKRNIKIIGEGRRNKISVNLPNNLDINYSTVLVITFEGYNCELYNLDISLTNGRYVMHHESNINSALSIKDSFLYTKNCIFTHNGNTGNTWTQWKSTTSVGIGFNQNIKLRFENCCFVPGIGGHDNYTSTNSSVEVINCSFSTPITNTNIEAFKFNQFGQEYGKTSYLIEGCDFGNSITVKLPLGTSLGRTIGYANIFGKGNSKFYYESDYDRLEITDIISYIYSTVSLLKFDAVDINGNLANGIFYGLSINSYNSGEKAKIIKNTYIKVSDLLLLWTPQAGDFVEAFNGKLVKSLNSSANVKIIEINNTLYLSI